MAWNPTPEVAVIRDAANRLDAPYAVIIYITKRSELAGASYGKTRQLCDHAGKFMDYLINAAQKWEEPPPQTAAQRIARLKAELAEAEAELRREEQKSVPF